MRLSRALAAMCAMLLVACSTGDGDTEAPASRSGPSTVRLATIDPATLLPSDANSVFSSNIVEVLYSGLVRYDTQTGEPYEYLADSITTTDNKTWKIAIREGWTFQNGEPVDAHAFARSWNYAAYGPHAMANNYFFERIDGYADMQGEWEQNEETGKVTVHTEPEETELSGLTVTGDYSLEVELTRPFVAFRVMLGYGAFFPLAKECVNKIERCALEPIGNGPFQVDGPWEPGKGINATRWDEYQGSEAPTYDHIEWVNYDEDASEWPDFLVGDVDIAVPPPSQWDKAINNPDLAERFVSQQGTSITFLGFPLTDDFNQHMRQAISSAIDRTAVIDAVLPGQALPADSWVPPETIPGGEAGTCGYCRFDLKIAKAELTRAGGWPEGKKMMIYTRQDPQEEAFFKAIGDQIKKNLDIDYKLVPMEFEKFLDKLARQDLDGPYRFGWAPDYALNENYLAPIYLSNADAYGWGYENSRFGDLMHEGDGKRSISQAASTYLKAERELASDFPTAPLSFTANNTFYSAKLDNVQLDPNTGAVVLRTLEVNG